MINIENRVSHLHRIFYIFQNVLLEFTKNIFEYINAYQNWKIKFIKNYSFITIKLTKYT